MDFHLLEGTVLANAFAWMRVRYVLDLMSLGARVWGAAFVGAQLKRSGLDRSSCWRGCPRASANAWPSCACSHGPASADAVPLARPRWRDAAFAAIKDDVLGEFGAHQSTGAVASVFGECSVEEACSDLAFKVSNPAIGKAS
jgi:hypothetical protein